MIDAKRKRDDTLLKEDAGSIGLDAPFPRGGGSSVAPLEIRKAAAEATNDVFEQMSRRKPNKRVKTKTPVVVQIKPEPLVLSKMKPGTLVLGEVVDIHFSAQELVVSLPNNLVGYCNSEILTAGLIGRFLRFVVVEESTRKKLQLSADPELVNDSIDTTELVKGLAVQGLVESIEEKGVLVDLGESLGKGFISGDFNYELREPVLAFVANAERRVKKLTVDSHLAAATVISQPSLVPGTLIKSAPVERETAMGCVYDLLGHIKATSDAVHSLSDETYVRCLFSYPPLQYNGERQLAVSRLPEIVNLQTAEPKVKVGVVTVGTVTKVLPNLGLFLTLPKSVAAFAHISHIGPDKVDLEDPTFKEGTEHRVRVISLSKVDNLAYISLDSEEIEQPFMSHEDVQIGAVIRNATVDRILPKGGVLVKLGRGLVGLASELQLSDAVLRNPETKFKEGQKVNARVINVDVERERIELSLKKSVVEFDGQILESYDAVNGTTIGTIIKLLDNGAKLGFFGGVRGFLPASEMSETGAKPADVLRLGQTVRVHVLESDANRDRLIVSSRPQTQLGGLIGRILSARVASKSKQEARVVLGDEEGEEGALGEATLIGPAKQVKVGDVVEVKVLTDRLVTSSAELVKADLPTSVEQLTVGQHLTGFVSGIQTTIGVFIGFAAGLVGLIPANVLATREWPRLGAIVQVQVDSVDLVKRRVFLSIPDAQTKVSATITAVKDTQLNVITDDGQPGRVDISEVFKGISDIADVERPLSAFEKGQKLELTVVGRHDARTHRFLPISHRAGTHVVLELVLNAHKPVVSGERSLAFVNNYSEDGLSVWVSLSPTQRGQMSLVDLTANADKLEDPERYFPVGCALEVDVLKTGPKMALTALRSESDMALVFNVDPLRLLVRLPFHKTAAISCVDSGDEFIKLESTFSVGDIVKFYRDNGKITLRSEPHEPVAEGQVREGFVWNIANGGVFVALAPNVIGRVQIGQLSDVYLKDWKNFVKLGDVVKCKVLSAGSKIELSLKPSVVTGQKQPRIGEIDVGKNYSGRVRRVETFGVFVDFHGVTGLAHKSEISDRQIDDLARVFKVGDDVKVKVLAKDAKAGRISLGMKARYFDGADASDAEADGDSYAGEDDMDAIGATNSYDRSEDNSGAESYASELSDSASDDAMELSESSESESESESEAATSNGLSAGFNWNGELSALDAVSSDSDSDSDDEVRQKRRRKREEFVKDETASLQTRLPQSDRDFERLLVATPESSVLWMNYMAFELQLGEIDAARHIARRALKTIPAKEEAERLNIWVALLNLEVQFGTDDAAMEVFAEAQQFMDSLTMHLRMAQVYAQAGKIQRAREIYKRAHKRFGGESLDVWLAEMRFFFTDGHDKVAARSLADQALQRLPQRLHRDFTRQFALLEFELGDPERGRTLFEALVAASPKRIDIWNVYIDQEIKHGDEQRFAALFDRVLQQRVSMKQAKFFFKKWIEVASDEDYVKLRAREYVEDREKKDVSGSDSD